MSALEIPWRELSSDALTGVIEEFVTREGTEYGSRDVDLATKVAQVRRQLERGEVLVFFDTEASSCQLVHRDSLSTNPVPGPSPAGEGRSERERRSASLNTRSSPRSGRGE